jgi:general secretion pathway protein A
MYESFYGLKEKPFNITPDPDYFYMSQVHENAYTHLQYAISENKGFVVVTGEIGSGKTTLINLLLKNIQQDVLVGVMSNSNVLPEDFVKMACQDLELVTEGMDRVEMMDALHQFLLKQFVARKRVVLIIDEAQNLPLETIEEIRTLSNLDTEKDHLIQMILVGQPELKRKLQRPELKQFVQRVTVHCHLRGLSKEEAGQYMDHRLHVAGAKDGTIFDRKAIEAVYEHSRGIPRMINILCDAALLYGYADDLKSIGHEAIEEVVKERRAEGFLFPSELGEQGHLSTTDAAPQGLDKRLQVLEKKVNVIGKAIIHVHRTLETQAKRSDQRDKAVMKALKMLHQSMGNPKTTALKSKQLRNKGSIDRARVLRTAYPRERLETKG